MFPLLHYQTHPRARAGSGDAPNLTVPCRGAHAPGIHRRQHGARGTPLTPRFPSPCGGCRAALPTPRLCTKSTWPAALRSACRAGRCPRLCPGHSPGMTWPGFPRLTLCQAPRGSCRAIPTELIMDNGTTIHPGAAGLCSLIYRLRRPLRCHGGQHRAGTTREMPRNVLRKPQLPLDSPKLRSSVLLPKAATREGREMPSRQREAAQHLQLAAPAMRQPRTKAISAMQGVPGRLANC